MRVGSVEMTVALVVEQPSNSSPVAVRFFPVVSSMHDRVTAATRLGELAVTAAIPLVAGEAR